MIAGMVIEAFERPPHLKSPEIISATLKKEEINLIQHAGYLSSKSAFIKFKLLGPVDASESN